MTWWAHWSFETDEGFLGQLVGTDLFVTDKAGAAHSVHRCQDIATEIGSKVSVADEDVWVTLPIGTVINMLRIHARS